jgi:hypothetical protein
MSLQRLVGGAGAAVVVSGMIAVWCIVPRGTSKPVAKPETPQQKIARRLDKMDQDAKELADRYLERISAFFHERKRGARPFAEAAFSWSGKWHLVKGKVLGDDSAGMRQYLQEHFETHVFKSEDLQAVLASALAGYLTDIQGLENQMLVEIRADLGDDQLLQGNAPELQSNEAFQEEYRRLAEQVLPAVTADLNVTITREIGTFIASEMVAQTLGRGLASRVAMSAGVFGALGRHGMVTFGVGVAAGFVIDWLVDWLLRLGGYDPAAQVAGQVEQALDRLEKQMIDGDPGVIATYQQLRQQERDDPSFQVQLQCHLEADQIEQSGTLGLRYQLQGLRELQSRLRREALKKLVSAQGAH